jgi:hypothetical protein
MQANRLLYPLALAEFKRVVAPARGAAAPARGGAAAASAGGGGAGCPRGAGRHCAREAERRSVLLSAETKLLQRSAKGQQWRAAEQHALRLGALPVVAMVMLPPPALPLPAAAADQGPA